MIGIRRLKKEKQQIIVVNKPKLLHMKMTIQIIFRVTKKGIYLDLVYFKIN
jgi:hypothetical protein